MHATDPTPHSVPPFLEVRNVRKSFGGVVALKDVSLTIQAGQIYHLMGENGCGKSTLIKILSGAQPADEGQILIDGEDILARGVDMADLRRRVGMVFQKPTPFASSIRANVGFALTHYERLSKSELNDRIEDALRQAALWDEVKDKLNDSALSLSGGQQQRLCIARTVAVRPEIILLDEPTSALDPISTAKIEELIHEMRERFTVVIVTHNMQQAARVSQRTAFFHLGELVEYDDTSRIFTNPAQSRTQDYITGRYG